MAEKNMPLKLDITEEEIPRYKPVDMPHYFQSEIKYVNDRRLFRDNLKITC